MSRRGRPDRPASAVLTIDMADLAMPNGYAVAVYRTFALMLHPDDMVARSGLVMSASFDMLDRHARAMTPPKVVSIHNKPREVEIRPTERIVAEAMAPVLRRAGDRAKADPESPHSAPAVAAAILRRAIRLAREWNPEVGIESVLEEQGRIYREQGLIGVGRDRLTEIWQGHRSVAHIAAAYAEIRGQSLQDRKVFFRWLGLAQDLLKIGGAIGNRFAEPILPPDLCWRIALTPSAMGGGRPGFSRASDSVTRGPPWSQWKADVAAEHGGQP